MDDAEAQNHLQKCLTFSHSGSPAENQKLRKENFWFLPATEGSGRGAQIGAYALVSLHHARGACEVITSLYFENRCEFGTIETPIRNSRVFLKQKCGTREATTIAVFLHEIPQEIGDFVVLIHSGYTTKRALFLNFLSALTAVVGVVIALIFGSVAETFTLWVLPIAAGGFIYIAVADLIPELQKTKELKYSIMQIMTVLIGILTMITLLVFE